MQNANGIRVCVRNWSEGRNVKLMRYTLTAIVIFALAQLALLAGPTALYAQSSNVPNGEDAQRGFHPGLSAGIRFEGSSSDDGSVYDLASTIGYNFTHHFGVDLGVPYYFIGTPTSIKTRNSQAVSGIGIGDMSTNFKGNLSGLINYSPTFSLGVPTGDTSKGLSTGHVTWNVDNRFDRSFGLFTPFIDAGIGNTLSNRWQFKRPFMVFGHSGQFEAGTGLDLGPLSLSGSAYDVLPWGTQTVISRVFRCALNTKCAPNITTDRRQFLLSSVAQGTASLARDNGFNSSVEVHPWPQLDLEFDYSRSVPLRLNTFSFGIALDLTSIMRPSRHSRTP